MPPKTAGDPVQSLQAVGLMCRGELREHLWQMLGWASPYLQECGADGAAEDEHVLETLELELCRLPVPHTITMDIRSLIKLQIEK